MAETEMDIRVRLFAGLTCPVCQRPCDEFYVFFCFCCLWTERCCQSCMSPEARQAWDSRVPVPFQER